MRLGPACRRRRSPGSDERTIAFDALIRSASPELEAEPTSPDAPAFWLYSSGSTGQPKGCVHLHHDMVVCAELSRKACSASGHDRCFSVAKLFFAYGLGNALSFPFSVGATAILWPGPPTPQNVYAVIERYRPTLFFSVPTGYGMLLAHTAPERDFDLSSPPWAVSAGEALPPALFHCFKRFGVDILDGIGSTEALHMFISNRPGASARARAACSSRATRPPARRARPPAARRDRQPLVRGDSACAGYWNQHEKTKDTIRAPGSGPATSTARTPTASTGTRAAPTTC